MLSRGKRLPRHLFVIRTSAMGDVAMLPHALRALMDAYPDLTVTVATLPLFRPFFKDLDVDFIDVYPQKEHRTIRSMLALAKHVRVMGIDAVADVHDVWRSKSFRLAMWLHGVKVQHIDKGHFEKWMRLKSGETCAVPLKHTVVRYCDTFRRLGFRFDDPLPATKRARPNPLGEKRGTWIGFAPFSAQTGKTYPLALSRDLAGLLSGLCERLFIHSGRGEELEFAQEMERLYPNVTAVYGHLDLSQEMDLISHEDCMVSMDSLAMHIASLVATPVVSLWGATHPSLGYIGYGCDPEDTLQVNLPCRPCSVYGKKECKFRDYHCLLQIEPRQVAQKVAEVLCRKQVAK